MIANELLLWMSARRAGSWSQFRGAVDDLTPDFEPPAGSDTGGRGLPLYQQLRLGFQALGHAEFFAPGNGEDWRVAPPVLAGTESNRLLKTVLCGARSPRLLKALERSADPSIALQTEEVAGQPQIVRVLGAHDSIARFAARAGISLQAKAPHAILSCLPLINDLRHLHPAVLPIGADWRVDRFDGEALRWTGSSRDEAVNSRGGLFRFAFTYERRHFLKLRGAISEVPGQIGKYLILRRRQKVLHYAHDEEELTVPASCRPPLLVDRALTLCSGVMPAFEADGVKLHYRNITADVARMAAQLLCQEI